MVCSTEEVNVDGKKRRKWYVWYAVFRYIPYAKFSKTLEVLRTFRLFVRNKKQSTYRQLHTIRHVNRSVWLAREAKPRSGAALERSTHDYETPLLISIIVPLE